MIFLAKDLETQSPHPQIFGQCGACHLIIKDRQKWVDIEDANLLL